MRVILVGIGGAVRASHFPVPRPEHFDPSPKRRSGAIYARDPVVMRVQLQAVSKRSPRKFVCAA